MSSDLMAHLHSSHMNSYEMLENTQANNIILLCLPSHTTHFLQSLDRSYFKSLKSYFKRACDEFIRANPGKRIEGRYFEKLLADSWTRAATTNIGISGFRATEIYPLKPSSIPEHAFISFEENNLPDQQLINTHPILPEPDDFSQSTNIG